MSTNKEDSFNGSGSSSHNVGDNFKNTTRDTNRGDDIIRRQPDQDFISKIEFYPKDYSHCGYCDSYNSDGQTNGRVSYDMSASQLTPQDYQDMLDRYWRRCGSYCYRPVNQVSCCPNYTISCKATKFNLSRGQRKCIQNLNSFLLNGDRDDLSKTVSEPKQKINYTSQDSNSERQQMIADRSKSIHYLEQLRKSSKARARRFVASCEKKSQTYNVTLDKALEMVIEKNIQRTFRPCLELEDYLYPSLKVPSKEENMKPKNRLEFRLQGSNSPASENLQEEKLKLIRKYQINVHKDNESQWDMRRYKNFLVKTPLIYQKMENFKHVDPDSDSIIYFGSDIEDSSLLVKPPPLPTNYGTYHCLYYLNDKLIAVGVLDALPKCLTTVYLFYDTDYKHLNLGIYSALVEISMVRRLSNYYCGPPDKKQLKHYYLGYYVHVCKKMHYKPTFRPSYLLCNETYKYIKTEDCIKKLQDQKYAKFSDEPNEVWSPWTMTDVFSTNVYLPSLSCNNLKEYLEWVQENVSGQRACRAFNRIFLPYYHLVGKTLAIRMQLQLNTLHSSIIETS